MKRVATIRVPKSSRTLSLRTSPQWKVAADTHTPSTTTSSSSTPHDPPAHIRGEWSRKIWTLKHKLEVPPYVTHWNTYKGFTNAFERIHTTSNRSRSHKNVAVYAPLSRSYFKMWEMLTDFELLGAEPGAIRTAHLAEGPGGFIEAVCRYRDVTLPVPPTTTATTTATTRPPLLTAKRDQYTGITLKPTRRDIPGWDKSARLLVRYSQIRLHYGADGTGNLYKVDNIHKLVRDVGRHTCALVTGDGGIDYSVDFSLQEPMSFRLLLAQVYASLLLLQPGKAMVCKFFDMHERFTHELLWVIAVVFDEVHLVKPVTSRVANSERYVVAKGYRGCPKDIEFGFRRVMFQWRSHWQLTTILQTSPPQEFLRAIHEYNEWYAEQQYRSIADCLRLIDAAVEGPASSVSTSDMGPRRRSRDARSSSYRPVRTKTAHPELEAELEAITERQMGQAVEWCERYGVAQHG